MDSDFSRHNETCRFIKTGQLKQTGDWKRDEELKNQNTLAKVDLTLHLFTTIEAAERSQRFLFGMRQAEIWDLEAWVGLYFTIENLIPVVYLRQGRDEKAYKFIYQHRKRCFLRPANAAWRRSDLVPFDPLSAGSYSGLIPIYDLRLSFEETQEHARLGHQVVLTLMAIRALRHVEDIQRLNRGLRGTIVGGKALPQETLNNVCEHLGTKSGFLEHLFGFDFIEATRDDTWRDNKISQMRALVMRCVYQTGRKNRHIWRLMLDTDRLAARSEFGQLDPRGKDAWDSQRTAEVLAIRQYQLWMETPGSFDALREAMAAAARWASKRGFCWPIERQPDDCQGMPIPHHHHQHYDSDDQSE